MADTPHDIFISYSRHDLAWARVFAQALKARGWTVFVDEEMKPGVEWSPGIDAAVDAAKAVIVIWSNRAKRSSYVISESTRAVVRGTLIPVRREPCEPPKVFARFQVEDMSVCGAGNLPEALITTIEARLEAPAPANAEEQRYRAEMAETAALSRDSGVPLLALQSQLERLGEIAVAPEQMSSRIEAFVTDYLQLKADLARATNADPEIARTHKRALALLDAGDLDQARTLFDDAVARMRQRQRQASREMATLLADRARVDRLQLRYTDAARAYEEAADLVRFDSETTLGHLEASIRVLIRQGDEFGDNAALLRAIETIRSRALPLVSRVAQPLDWARLHGWLGIALLSLGERESGPARLEEAVVAYRAALQEYTRERDPPNWAMTQNNLGNALRNLGERESGTARLEEAVATFRAVLEVSSRERVPLNWATAQMNLGSALAILGQRESGTTRLEEAVDAYRAALREHTRERAPLEWARTQNNLGIALRNLGERESGTARLEEAVATYRAALQECTRERVPLDWAMMQYNLGAALRHLGERESGTGRLEDAVAAYRAALEEQAPERAPYFHARTQANLDHALALLAKRRRG